MTRHASNELRGDTPVVELIYDADCPNVDACRAALRVALAEATLPAAWTEWDRDGRATPAAYRGYSSPTVLVDGNDVDGNDVAGTPDSVALSGSACRLYASDGISTLSGAPSSRSIRNALAAAMRRRKRGVLASDTVA